jgi:RNA polymerase sigma-70 factor (ECF subfamily)
MASLTLPQPVVSPNGAAPVAAFDALLVAYQAEIYRYALQLTRNPTDADDLFQETMLKAYRAFDRLNGEANHRAWLYRIATNTLLDGRRRAGRERPLDPVIDDHLATVSPDQAASIDARDLLIEVQAAIQDLPPKQRAALVMRKYHGIDYGQIAEALKTSEGAARADVYEGLRKLRARFGDRL